MTESSNPYAALEGLDLSSATFSPVKLDRSSLDSAIAAIDQITNSNLEAQAKWNSILMTVDAALRTVGLATRLVAVI